jgi:hypothetical protein
MPTTVSYPLITTPLWSNSTTVYLRTCEPVTDLTNNSGPEPGWYPDPVTGTGHRYWNGVAWTDDHSADAGADADVGGLQSVGPWLSETFRLVFGRVGHLFVLIVLLTVPAGLLTGAILYSTFSDGVLLIETDANDVTTGFDVTGIDGSDGLIAALTVFLNRVAGVVLAAAVSRHIVFARTDRAESWSSSLLGGAKRTPRVLGVALLLVVVFALGVVVLLVGPILFPFLYIVTIPAFVVGGLWVWARLTLATTAAAVAPNGVGSIANSLKLSKGLVPPLIGRLLLLVVITLAVQFIASVATAPFASGSIEAGATEMAFRDIMGGNPYSYALQQVIGAIASGFSAALFGAGMALIYLDLGGQLHGEFAHDGATT